MDKTKTVESYMKTLPENVQEKLNIISKIIKKIAPDAVEVISYGIPAYKLQKPFIYFAGYKHHVSLYPAPRGKKEFEKELSKYRGGKGTIQFPLDQPLPLELIEKVIKFRLEETLTISK